MIQIYKAGNSNFKQNGDMVLFPTVCNCKAILKDSWELTLTHPIDDEGQWKFIENEAVVKVNTFMTSPQLFKISNTKKTDIEVTAVAYPIFFDSGKEVFVLDTRPTNKTGQEALNILTGGTKYSGKSDIKTVSSAYFIRKNLLEALNGDEDQSFINRWGGEPIYDNYNVIFNQRAGGDYGVDIRYGKNLSGLDEKIDMSEVITRIVPVAYSGHMLDGDKPWVISDLLNMVDEKRIALNPAVQLSYLIENDL